MTEIPMSKGMLSSRHLWFELQRKQLTQDITIGLKNLRRDSIPTVRSLLDAAILRETEGLDVAKRETERLYGHPLHSAPIKVV